MENDGSLDPSPDSDYTSHFYKHEFADMVEIDDAEFMIIADFINAIELDPNSPDDLKNKYTDALQVINAFGPAQAPADTGVAAPA